MLKYFKIFYYKGIYSVNFYAKKNINIGDELFIKYRMKYLHSNHLQFEEPTLPDSLTIGYSDLIGKNRKQDKSDKKNKWKDKRSKANITGKGNKPKQSKQYKQSIGDKVITSKKGRLILKNNQLKSLKEIKEVGENKEIIKNVDDIIDTNMNMDVDQD